MGCKSPGSLVLCCVKDEEGRAACHCPAGPPGGLVVEGTDCCSWGEGLQQALAVPGEEEG